MDIQCFPDRALVNKLNKHGQNRAARIEHLMSVCKQELFLCDFLDEISYRCVFGVCDHRT